MNNDEMAQQTETTETTPTIGNNKERTNYNEANKYNNFPDKGNI
jgi:hypothetical protein